jgi:hypothetical protein
MRIVVFLIVLACGAHWAFAAQYATIVASGQTIALQKRGSAVLLNADQVAKAYGWRGKSVAKLTWVACKKDRCVPVSLTKGMHETKDGVLWIDAGVLGRALGFTVRSRNGRIELIVAKAQPAIAAVPSYHTDWGSGRGFKNGQPLPDIPLVDMEGKEVRFGQFLGKRYIIYGWASW